MSAAPEEAAVRVLLVDDQATVGEVVRRMLAREVDVAYRFCDDSRQALTAARELSPTVILQDLQMPDIDGFALLEMYMMSPHTRDVPVMMLTGKEDPESKARAFALGACDYLVKVPDRIELVARIRRHSEGYVNLQRRRRTEEALRAAEAVAREAAAAADDANRAKSTFLANLSHEIRTPMNAILGYAQILAGQAGLTPDQDKGLSVIQQSGQHLLELINDVLDISKIEAGRAELAVVDFDLGTLVRSLGLMFEQRCHAKDLRWLLQDELPAARVRGDESKLRQVLINLVGNAVKFTGRGEVALRAAAVGGGEYLFEVRDTGPGIPPEHQAAVFEPFHQGEAGHQHGGTGLGLAIARSHVAMMGGQLRLESSPGAGARFTFTLPLAPAQSAAAGDADERWGRVRHLAADHAVRALVVDGPADGEICRRLLTRIGVEVDVVHDASAALRCRRQRPPDIVLIDNRLPGQDGAHVRRRLADDCGDGDAVPTVCTTTAVLAHQRQALREEGFEHFLDKPVRAAELYACLSALLDVAYVYDEVAADDAGEPDSFDWKSLSVAAEMAHQLEDAADRQSLTELKQHLEALAALGRPEARLASHLQQLIRRFDMEAVKEIARQL